MNAKSKQKGRIAIVKDVIKTLKLPKKQRYQPLTNNTYVRIAACPKNWENKPLDKLFKKNIADCQVCGLGAMFISMVKLYDDVATKIMSVEDDYDNLPDRLVADSEDVPSKLGRYFSKDQREAIEMAFEHGPISDDRDRLRSICQNILDNKGTFEPEEWAVANTDNAAA
jgi:hypothetical protein